MFLGLPTRSFSSGRPRHPTFGRCAPSRGALASPPARKPSSSLLFLIGTVSARLWNPMNGVALSIRGGTNQMRQSGNILR